MADVTARSHAAALWVHVSFMYGLGLDEDALSSALDSEDLTVLAPMTLQATAVRAVVAAWSGDPRTCQGGDGRRRCAMCGTGQ